VNVKIYDGTTLLQTIEAVPNRDVKVPMIRKNTSIIQGLYTDSSLENAWDYVTDKDIAVYAKWEDLLVPDAEAAGNDVSKYTVVSFSGKRSGAFMYFLEAGFYCVEWNDSWNKGPFADLDNINFTDCYICILNENGEVLYRNDDGNLIFDVSDSGIYSIIVEGRNSDMQEAAFHIYSYNPES
nr:hypothetical protein [Treponema sp.]